MSKTQLRIASALAALALLGGSAGVASLASAAGEVTTQAATGISQSNATLNGTNGTTAATGSGFWVSTSTFSPSASTSPTLPSGVFSTGDLGAVGSSTNFSASLSSATVPSGLLPITAGTTYYYVAWTKVGGTWFPGATLNFSTTASSSATGTPMISNVNVTNIGSTSATVNWTTDIAASGTVWYGLTSGYGNSVTDNSISTSHSVTLNNLSPNTLYHFTITAAGSTSTGTTTDRTFTTASSTATTTPLAVNGIDAVRTTAIADNTFANGWEWVMHLTVPNNEDAFHIKFTDWTMNGNSSVSFPTANNVQVWSAQSSNASSSSSAVLNTGTGYGGWLYLTGDANPSMPGRQVDLHIMVKIPTGTAAGNYTTTFTAQSWPQNSTSTAPTI